MGTLGASGNRSTQVVVAERNMVEAERTWRRRKEREEGGSQMLNECNCIRSEVLRGVLCPEVHENGLKKKRRGYTGVVRDVANNKVLNRKEE